jgi:hypothetical protein
MASLSHRQLNWLLIITVNATIPAMLIWERRSGELSIGVAVISAFLSLTTFNVVILRAIRVRDRKAGLLFQQRQIVGAIALALVSLGFTALAVTVMPARNDYVELALSRVPIDRIHPRQKALVVELIRQRAASSREYDRVVEDAKAHPLSPPLYSADSFATSGVIHRTVDRVKYLGERDLAYADQQRQAEDDFRNKMKQVDPDYLAAWDSVRKGELAAAESAERFERMWLSSVVDLYSYAEKNLRNITVKKGQLWFSDQTVEMQFNALRKKSETLQEKHQDLVRGLRRERQQLRAETGLPQ